MTLFIARLYSAATSAVLFAALWAVASSGFAAQLIVPAPPNLDVAGYVLMDFHSGTVIAQKNAEEPASPASITKLMTAYLVYEALAEGAIHADDQAKVSETAWKTLGSRMFIEVGSRVAVEDLIMGVVVQSGNDASVALAEHVAGSEPAFVDMMNQKAAVLGMINSNFANVTGLPAEDHYMTAQDIAKLSRALIRDFPEYYKTYAVREFTYNDIKQHNRNTLLHRDASVDGLKTGHTKDAGYCLAASALRDGMRLISVVLGSDSKKERSTQTAQLFDYGFRFFSTRRLYEAMQPMYQVRVWGGEPKHLQLGVAEDFYVTVPRGIGKQLGIESRVVEEIDAPISQMQPLGVIKVSYGDEFDREEPLVAISSVPQGGIVTRVVDGFLKLF